MKNRLLIDFTLYRASAGVAEHCIMYPVDVVKTRMQALACNTPKFQSKSIVRNILFMMREEGFWRPVQGVQAMALGAGPAHAMYFLSYETMKERLAPKFKQVTISLLKYFSCVAPHFYLFFQVGAPEFTMHLLAGCGATFFHDSVMTPAEVHTQNLVFRHCLNAILITGYKAADANVLLSFQKCHLCLQGENILRAY